MSFTLKPQPFQSQTSQPSIISKSTVLAGAGLQDAYWSDDEDEDAECPLCLEEMDVAEMGFKPCPCGYQICMFCYHHIKSNLNGRCPACRREYSEDTVEFTAVAKEDLKRQAQQKKRKERERKELEALGRRHFANVRVVQRNVVYVVGLGPRFAKEELIPTLRSHEFFGQYGKISKMIISKRHLPGSKSSVVGVYVTYLRREDATKAINALDGSPSPAGDNETLRASYGTTKYCMSFLRGLNCANNACVDLHEWGDKTDCFTKEDLTTLKHTLNDSENQPRAMIRKKPNESEGPRHTPWTQKSAATPNVQSLSSRPVRSTPVRPRNPPSNRPPAADQSRSSQRAHDRRPPGPSYSNLPTNNTKTTASLSIQDTQTTPATVSTRIPSVSPPEQPSSPILPAIARARAAQPSPRPVTPTTPNPPDSDVGSSVEPDSQISSALATHVIPPGLQHPVYQISTPAQELLNETRSRRDVPSSTTSPFPEFDRTLENLGRTDFNFKWTMDVNLTPSGNNSVPDAYRGSFDPFSATTPGGSQGPQSIERRASHISTPPGLTPSPRLSQANAQVAGGYRGAFNPFADADDDLPHDNRDGNRQESRFGFARRRPSSSINESPKFNAFSTPLHTNDVSPHLRQQFGMPWSHAPASRSAFNSPALYSASPPGLSYEYTASPSILKMNTLSPEVRSEQQPVFPPGLNFQLYDNMDDRIRPSSQMGHVPHVLDFQTPSVSANKIISQISDASSVPPGFSSRDVHSEYPSEGIRPTAIFPHSGTPSNHRSSISSTPANASPHSPFATSWDQPTSIEKPILLPEDFPALPTSTVSDSNSKREVPSLVTKETKVSSHPAIHPRKLLNSALNKDTKSQTKQAESSIKSPATAAPPRIPTPPPADTTQLKAPKVRKSERKEDKKNELKEEIGFANSAPSVPKPADAKDSGKLTKVAKAVVSVPAPEQAPMFSKVSKKSKPKEPRLPKTLKENKEESKAHVETSKDESSATTGTTTPQSAVAEVSSTISAQIAPSLGDSPSVATLIEQIIHRGFDLSSLAFFNPKLLETDSTPLQYDPLVHALSALSVGGGSFANNLPPVSIDSAVSSFQQLLETLTKTISDLLRLLPPATWDDSSSFDSVLRDMLKGDDFLDDTGDENGKDDEVAALTLALEKRARWMEVQLAKLEELHRDINMAAVRAILTVSDRGWDPCGFMHRTNAEATTSGNSLARFDNLGMVQGKEKPRRMTTNELQKALGSAKQEEKVAKQAVLDSMAKIAAYFPAVYED